MSAPTARFRFVQLEFAGRLGPDDGRYAVREAAGMPIDQVLVLATLGAPYAAGLLTGRRARSASAEPAAAPVPLTRATVVDSAELPDERAAQAWLAEQRAEPDVERQLATLNAALHAHRIAAADPLVRERALDEALAVRIGYGRGDQVAIGGYSEALELTRRQIAGRRRRALAPQERVVAILSGRQPALACEELALRSRHDLAHARGREALLGLAGAFDAALAELPGDASAPAIAARLEELRALAPAVAGLARAALEEPPPATALEAAERALGRLEAALRARTVAVQHASGS